jgi:hypothetical protein
MAAVLAKWEEVERDVMIPTAHKFAHGLMNDDGGRRCPTGATVVPHSQLLRK